MKRLQNVLTTGCDLYNETRGQIRPSYICNQALEGCIIYMPEGSVPTVRKKETLNCPDTLKHMYTLCWMNGLYVLPLAVGSVDVIWYRSWWLSSNLKSEVNWRLSSQALKKFPGHEISILELFHYGGDGNKSCPNQESITARPYSSCIRVVGVKWTSWGYSRQSGGYVYALPKMLP